MRRAFLALLLANLLYAGWALLVPRQSADSAPRQSGSPQYPERLQLASEQLPAPAGPGSAETPHAPAAPEVVLIDAPVSPSEGSDAQAPASPQPTCVKIGPLEGAVAERLRRRIDEWVDGARVVLLDVPDRSVYWVHVPPLASDADARAVVQALSGKGIDSFVIRDEPALLHGVSLGVFRDEESARSLQDRMSGIGHPVEIHEERRYRAAEFVVGTVPGEAPGVIPQGLRDAVAAAAPRAEASAAPCADIAPGEAPD